VVKTPKELKYSKSHEWVRVEGDVATVGISDYAQDALTDVVFVELPKVGDAAAKGSAFGVVESVKSVSELYAPVSGKIVEVKKGLTDAPEKINDDPYGEGWLIKIKLSKPAELSSLLDSAAYEASVGEDGH
jgi:glycine cleavage system H protein